MAITHNHPFDAVYAAMDVRQLDQVTKVVTQLFPE